MLIPSKKQNVFNFNESFKAAWGHSSWQCESRLGVQALPFYQCFYSPSVAVGYITAQYQITPCVLAQQVMKGDEHCFLQPETFWEYDQKMASPPRILFCWDETHAWTLSVGWRWQKDGLGWHVGSTMTNSIRELVPYGEYPYCCKTCKEKAVKTSDLILLQD